MHKPGLSLDSSQADGTLRFDANSMIGSSPTMREIRRDMARVARSASTVLITGETGTGKELAAEFIHENSPRCKNIFVCINCAAIPDSLLESELFGHAKGAFTGAERYRDGLFLSADGGTVFLDEIGDMSLCAQAKILRVIEKREVCRVGANRGTQLDIRFVAATNQDLESMVSRGSFRKDLFFRLNVARVHLPPLRERVEDIPSLLLHYCLHFGDKIGTPVPEFSEECLHCMLTYDWPGNVRELKNLVEGLFLRDLPQRIEAKDLPIALWGHAQKTAGISPQERDTLLAALFECKWNKSEAAKKLHWSRMTLYRKLAKYQIVKGSESDCEQGLQQV